MMEITEQPIDLNAILRHTTTEEDGGLVFFLGRVRRHSNGERVIWLDYEAYPAMALKSFHAIADEVRARWGVERLSIIHRVGRLIVGDIAVVVAAASPHRTEAFAACQYAIDRVKEMSPIWKKELTQDGCVWIGEGAKQEECHA